MASRKKDISNKAKNVHIVSTGRWWIENL